MRLVDPREAKQIQTVADLAVQRSLAELADAREGMILNFVRKIGADPRTHAIISITASHAFDEKGPGYRELIVVMPQADERHYDTQRIDPALTRLLQERYPSLMIRAKPVVNSVIVSERGHTRPRNSL